MAIFPLNFTVTVFFFLGLIMSSCSEVYFDSAMPKAIKSANIFDTTLIGNYNYNDSVLILKNEVYFNSKFFDKEKISMDSFNILTANLYITPSKLFYRAKTVAYYKINKIDTNRISYKHRKELKRRDNGFLSFENELIDTLFNIKNGDLIKRYNGKYYLNHFIAKNKWEVFQIRLNGDTVLSIGLTNAKDQQKLSNYRIKKNQIMGNIATLSDAQFYSYVKNGGFRTRYHFKKIK